MKKQGPIYEKKDLNSDVIVLPGLGHVIVSLSWSSQPLMQPFIYIFYTKQHTSKKSPILYSPSQRTSVCIGW